MGPPPARARRGPRATWSQRLHLAQAAARRRLARSGLSAQVEPLLVDELLSHVGPLLKPSLPTAHADARAIFEQVPVGEYGDVDGVAFAWLTQAVEAAFLFGVITGTCVPWETVLAAAPPIGGDR